MYFLRYTTGHIHIPTRKDGSARLLISAEYKHWVQDLKFVFNKTANSKKPKEKIKRQARNQGRRMR